MTFTKFIILNTDLPKETLFLQSIVTITTCTFSERYLIFRLSCREKKNQWT